MTEESDFYSGTSTDTREYDAADWSRFFRAILTDGVVYGKLNEMVVSALSSPGMSVNVASGVVWVYGNRVKSPATEVKTIAANTSGNPRIDRIILRNTLATGITIEVLQGTPGGSPSAPALTQTGGTYYEISLAQVAVANGASQIVAGDITDERDYTTLKYVRQSALVHPIDIAMGGNKIEDLADGTDLTSILTKAQFDDAANYSPAPTGIIRAFGTTTIPGGWLECDGTAVSRTTYATLFALIGTTFGAGDGSTTFALPNLENRFIIGHNPSDTDFDTLGETGGAATVTLTTDEIPSHLHGGIGAVAACAGNAMVGDTIGTVPTAGTVGSAGLGGAHNNLPPYLKLAWGIKT